MDTLTFTATEAAVDTVDNFLVAGVVTNDRTNYLSFQRGVEIGDEEDWGVHVEYNGQINSGYNRIASCRVTRTGIQVKFTEPIDPHKRFGDADLRLELSDEDYVTLTEALKRVFTRFESLLSIE